MLRGSSVHQALCQRRRRAASPTLPAPVLGGTPMLRLLLRPRPPPPSPRAPRHPAVLEPPGCAAEAQGLRHRARPFAQPRRWGSAQRAGAGRGDGVLTPSPSPSPPGTAGSRPCPMPASPPRHTRPVKAAMGSSPALGQSTSGPRVLRALPTEAGCCACATPALERMRFLRLCPFSTFGGAGLKKGEEK